MEPLTERRPVNGPSVYGFLRLVRSSAARQAALRASLEEYCRAHELQLCGIFTDRHVTVGPASAAFTGLLDVLVQPDVYGVVAPALSHLGPQPIAAERARRIAESGGLLLLARHSRGSHPSASRRKPTRRRYAESIRVLDAE